MIRRIPSGAWTFASRSSSRAASGMDETAGPAPLGVFQDFRAVMISRNRPGLDARRQPKCVSYSRRSGAGTPRRGSDVPVANGQKALPFESPTIVPGRDRQGTRSVEARFKQYPESLCVRRCGSARCVSGLPVDGSLRHASTHILARELTEVDVRESLAKGAPMSRMTGFATPPGSLSPPKTT